MIKKLVYEKRGISIEGDCDKSMWPIDDILGRCSLILLSKSDIIKDVTDENKLDYTFNETAAIRILNDKEFLLFHPEFEDDLEYRLKVPQQALWKLLEEYDKVVDTDWKKMEITFDGKVFELNVER